MTRFVKVDLTALGKTLRSIAALAVVPLAVVAEHPPVSKPTAQPAFGNLPLYFEAVPAAGEFRFLARGRQCQLSVAPTTAVLTLLKSDPAGSPVRDQPVSSRGRRVARELGLEFLGANPAAAVSGVGILPGRANYFLGNDPAQWRTDVPLFARVRVEQLYPGVDLIYYGNENRLEYDFVVSPHTDPAQVVLQFTGADRMRLNAEGDLVFTLGGDEVRQPKPFVYQEVRGTRKPVTGSYVLRDGGRVTFQLGEYDRALPLVIDPVLSYASYFGGSGVDVAWDVAVDADGFVYLAGESMGGLPVRSGTVTNAFSGSDRDHGDAFVAKFDNAGTNLIYLAYIGGRTVDAGLSVAVDAAGSAYVTGYTESTNFPTVNALFPVLKGQPYPGVNAYPPDAFVSKLSATGSTLLYSTYLGGSALDVGSGMAIDPDGNAYVAGYTESTNFVTVNADPALANYRGNGDAFLAKLDVTGTNLLYAIYLGGTNRDVGWDVVADEAGTAFMTGTTRSTNFPAWNLLAGGMDAFVTAVAVQSNLAQIVSSELVGGRADNAAYRIAMDGGGGLYLAGSTTADPTFLVTPSPLNPGGVFRSDNGGTNWNLWSTGLVSVVVEDLALDPENPANLFAATGRGIGQSIDGGANWVAPFPYSPNAAGLAPAGVVDRVSSVAIAPGTPATIYAGVSSEGIAKSLDGGTNWLAPMGLEAQTITTLAVDPVAPMTVYAGTLTGIFKTRDGGTNWTAINNGLGSPLVRALMLNPITPTTLYAATDAGVYRSTNAGTNWVGFNDGLTSTRAQALALHPGTPSTIYVGTVNGVFKSANGGTNWARLGAGLSVSNVTALVLDPSTPTTLYAGTTNGLFKSADGGTNWLAHNNGLLTKHILSLAIHPTSPATLYAGTKGNILFGGRDAFVARAGANGYFAILGGAGDDEARAVAVDSDGHAHVTGTTASTDFPTADALGILRPVNSGGTDAFVVRLSGDGGTLEHAAYLGGSGTDAGYGIGLDSQGNSFVVGATSSANFPTYDAFQATTAGGNDAFLVKIIGESRPRLTIASTTNAHEVVFTWPAYWTGFTIEGARTVDETGPWFPQGGGTVTNGVFYRTLNLLEEPTFFFRLRKF